MFMYDGPLCHKTKSITDINQCIRLTEELTDHEGGKLYVPYSTHINDGHRKGVNHVSCLYV